MERATTGTSRHRRFRATRALWAWAVMLLALAPSLLVAVDLEAEYELESKLLENELDRYVEARERESSAIQEVRRIASDLADVLASPTSSLAEMRQLEADLAVAREAAYVRLQETAQIRERMYNRMERLAEIARGLRRQDPEPVQASADGPVGLWEFHLQGADIHSLVDLDFGPSGIEGGWTVVGSYRNSNGHRGTVRGLFRANRLELEAMDSRRGKVATFDGSVASSGRLSGTWVAVQSGLDPGRPAGGTWTAQRVSDK